MVRTRSGIVAGLPAVGLLAVALAACTSPAAGPTPTVSAGPDAVRIAARDLRFDRTTLEAPAGRPFPLVLDNQEGAPHNVAIMDAAGATVFSGQVFSGPAQRVETVPALPAGTYSFICVVHPDMRGTLTAS